jgi:hypothetical protein
MNKDVKKKRTSNSLKVRQENREVSKAELLKALEVNLGNVTDACKYTGISRMTHYLWMREDENYKAQVESIDDIILDFAEKQLYTQISENNTTATIFFLKTKGKHRGYVEKTEVDNRVTIEKPLIIDWTDPNIQSDTETK